MLLTYLCGHQTYWSPAWHPIQRKQLFLQHYRVAFILCITILSGKMSLKRFQLHTMEDMQVLNKLPLTISRITCIGAILCMTGLLWNQHTTPKRTFIKWSFEKIWINLKDSLWIPRMGKWFRSWYNVRLTFFYVHFLQLHVIYRRSCRACRHFTLATYSLSNEIIL